MSEKENRIKAKSSVEQALTKEDRRGAHNKLYDGNPAKSAEISKIVDQGRNNLMTAYHKSTILGNDTEEIIRRTNDFINGRITAGQLPTIEGWATALGMNRSTLQRWIAGSVNSESIETVRFLQLAKEYMSDVAATAALSGNVPPVPWIFYAKNHFDYADKVEVAVEPRNPLGPTRSIEEIAKKYDVFIMPEDDEI